MKGEILDLDEVLKILKGEMDYLRKRFHVKRIGVFGSVVKGCQRKDSDLDLYVEFDIDHMVYDDYLELVEHLESIFGKKIDVMTKYGLETIRIPHVKESIKRSIIYVQE